MDTITLVKIASALIYPAGFSLVLLIATGIFFLLGFKRLRRFCVVMIFFTLGLTSNPQFAGFIAGKLEQRYPQSVLTDIRKHDAVIVLGGGLRIPLTPARHTQIGSGSDRLWYAVRLYRAGLASKVVLTGGNVFSQPGYASEAEYAAQLLREWGVPASAIIIEIGSRSTRENRNNTAHTLAQHNIESALLVTSALHMPRAYALFKKLPIVVTPASADVLVRSRRGPAALNWIPSASALHLSTVALHEYYGLLVDVFLESSKP